MLFIQDTACRSLTMVDPRGRLMAGQVSIKFLHCIIVDFWYLAPVSRATIKFLQPLKLVNLRPNPERQGGWCPSIVQVSGVVAKHSHAIHTSLTAGGPRETLKLGQTLVTNLFFGVCAPLSCSISSSLLLYINYRSRYYYIRVRKHLPAKMVETPRVTEARKGMHAAPRQASKSKVLIINSVDDTHHQHKISLGPHYARLQSQEARLQIPSCRLVHR